MKTRRNRSAPPPPTGWSSLPDEVACAVLALSSADGFGAAGSVCKRFGRLVSTGAVTVARSRACHPPFLRASNRRLFSVAFRCPDPGVRRSAAACACAFRGVSFF